MTEKEQLIQEIDQIREEHNRKRTKRRRIWAVGAGTVLLLLIVIGAAALSGDGEKGPHVGPYASIAGTYEIFDVDVIDMFDFPDDYYDMGECTISGSGSIEFPYYDGEENGEGEFAMAEGTLKRYEYADHDYEIEVPGYTFSFLYLDVTPDGIRIHAENTYHGRGQSAYFREIDYYFE